MLGIFLDTETNGLNPFKHQVLQIALKILDLRTGAFLASYEATLALTPEEWKRSDLRSLAINGMNWQEVEKGLTKDEVSHQIQTLFQKYDIQRGKAVFICQNPSFDRPFFAQLIDPNLQEHLLWPYHWLDLASMHWARAMKKREEENMPYPWDIGCSKDKIAEAYQIEPEKKPHRAMNGVDHLILCYRHVVGFLEEKATFSSKSSEPSQNQ